MYDFITFFDEDDLTVGVNYEGIVRKNIITAAKEGYVLAFIDKDLSNESWQYEEIKTAMRYDSRIIPVVSAPLTNEALLLFGKLNWIDVQNMSVAEASDYIVNSLMRIDSHYNQ